MYSKYSGNDLDVELTYAISVNVVDDFINVSTYIIFD